MSTSEKFNEASEPVKVFVGDKMGPKLYLLHEDGRVGLLTSGNVAPEALRYLHKHLPPLTAEEEGKIAQFSIRPHTPK